MWWFWLSPSCAASVTLKAFDIIAQDKRTPSLVCLSQPCRHITIGRIEDRQVGVVADLATVPPGKISVGCSKGRRGAAATGLRVHFNYV